MGILLTAVLMVSAVLAPPAAAQVNWAAVRNLARVAAQAPRPQVIVGAAEAAGAARYGVADAALVAQLDDAGRALGANVDQTAASVGASHQAPTFRECVGERLHGAGQSYRGALKDAAALSLPIPAPSNELVVGGVSGCLQSYYPDASDAVIQLGEHLASLAMQQASQANQAADSGLVLAGWMEVTGAELANAGASTGTPVPASPEVPPAGSTSEAADGDGFPAWAAIAMLAALPGVAWLVRRRS